nr:adenosylcobinamide-GDP ribazoletransferase [Kovacikia minuta]
MQIWGDLKASLQTSVFTLLGAIAFYTCIPIPHQWRLEFNGIARWAPLIGLAIGGLLGLLDSGLHGLGMPVLVRSAVVVAVWVGITGGLHLDGAMDTADGLAVIDPQRRLEVMADSHTGAFGSMVAVLILLLKTTALATLSSDRCLALMVVAAWRRWGQLLAIVRYPYLKATGKGAFHKIAICSVWETVPTLLLLLSFSILTLGWGQNRWLVGSLMGIGGCTISLLTGAWFNHKLGGHTGDTYGAVVEWTEALLLCALTLKGWSV